MDDNFDEILKLDNQVCFPLYAATRLVVQAYRPLLGELGLTYPQYLVMLVLWETDGASVGQIGEVLYLDSGTLTPLLKRLEKQALVSRRRRVEDDRTVENWLSDKGKALREKAAGIPTELICSANLSVDHLTELKANLECLLDKLLLFHELKPAPEEANRRAAAPEGAASVRTG